MIKKINIAVIGTGSMGRTHSYSAANLRFYYENLPFIPVLHTICSRDKHKGEQLKNDWGFLYSETDINKILSNPEIDVVDICTPNVYHFETIMGALSHGKNIYCEKPLVISGEQAAQVLAGASGSTGVNAVVFNHRFFPAILRARQLIEENRLGRIISFRCAYLHDSNMDINKTAHWKQDLSIGGGGVLFDLGSHAIDLMRFLLSSGPAGDFQSVSGASQIFFPIRKGTDGSHWHTNTDEAFYITAKLTDGAVGTIEASKLALGTNAGLTFSIYGEYGALKFDMMQPNYLEFYDNARPGGEYGGEKGFTKIECVQRYPSPSVLPGVKVSVGWIRSHMHCYYLYLDSVYNGRLNRLLPTLSDGAAVQNIMEKAYLSDKTGRWETL